MVGGLGALLMVLAISICIPYSTQEAPKKKSHQAHPTDYNVTQSRQELLAFYQDMQSQGKVYSDNRTTSAPTELHPDPFVCMVSVMKDEELFVDEWIAYHHFIGIDYFFICDHGKTSLQTFLAPHIEAGYLTVMPWYKLPHIAGINDQCSCYELAFHLMNEKLHPELKACAWVAMIDGDEFVTFRDRQGKGILKSYLSTQPSNVGALWLLDNRFGNNGHFFDAPPESLVVSSFTRRENGAETGRRTKTISRVNAIRLPIISMHYLFLGPGFQGRQADEKVLVSSHYTIRSYIRYMHRTIRGSASHSGIMAIRNQDLFVWRFVTSVVGLNNVEDRRLTVYADDIIDHLGRLGIWGHNRTERLKPYQLVMDIVTKIESGKQNQRVRKFVERYYFPSPKPRPQTESKVESPNLLPQTESTYDEAEKPSRKEYIPRRGRGRGSKKHKYLFQN